MWHFAYRAIQDWKLLTCLFIYTVKKCLLLTLTLKYTFKAEHKFTKSMLLSLSDQCSRLLLNDIPLRQAAGLRLFPSFPQWLLLQWAAGLLSDRLRLCKGCREEGRDFSLTAWQSMVKVDVAQVFWRPFWQTHFVVIVDHPPAEGEEHLCELPTICALWKPVNHLF